MKRTQVGSRACDRAGVFLGVAAIAFAGFVFGAQLPTEFAFVHIGVTGAVVLVVSGTLAIGGGMMRRPALSAAAGALLIVAALVQVAGLAVSLRPLGGDASTMSVMGGLGIGLLTVALAARSLIRTHSFDER
jgi:hypothetical protein